VNFLKLYKDILEQVIRDKDTIVKFAETVEPEFLQRRAADRNASLLHSTTKYAPEITGLLLKKMRDKVAKKRRCKNRYGVRPTSLTNKIEVLESIKKYCTYDGSNTYQWKTKFNFLMLSVKNSLSKILEFSC